MRAGTKPGDRVEITSMRKEHAIYRGREGELVEFHKRAGPKGSGTASIRFIDGQVERFLLSEFDDPATPSGRSEP